MAEEQSLRKQPGKKETVSKEALEQAIKAHKSYWPFALALALIIMLVGVIVHPIVLGVGLALVAVAIIGWGLEHH